MEKTREFLPGSRYHYDWLLCPKGYAQIDNTQDASYYGIWANPETFIIFSYTEGDCCTTLCENKEEFINEMRAIKDFHKEDFKGIDPGLKPGSVDPWHKLGLSDLLY